VPCSIPVGTGFSPAASASRITSAGTASVEMSMSVTGWPRSAFRTQPPTKNARCPPRSSASKTACVASAAIQSPAIRISPASGRPAPAASARWRPRCSRGPRAPRSSAAASPATCGIRSRNASGSVTWAKGTRRPRPPLPPRERGSNGSRIQPRTGVTTITRHRLVRRKRPQHLDICPRQADLLLRLAQRRAHRAAVARIDLAARKGDLPRMMLQPRGALGQQDLRPLPP
jgi:hypothetical protein